MCLARGLSRFKQQLCCCTSSSSEQAVAMDSDNDDPGPDLAKQARALYTKLRDSKHKGKATWWGAFDVLLEGHNVWLTCLRCDAKLSASNPSRGASTHLESKACIKAAAASKAAAEAAAAATAACGADAGTDTEVVLLGTKRQRITAADYMATAGQVTKARESLAKFFFKGGVAFNLIEHEDLVASFAALGVTLPNRKALAGKLLDSEYERVSATVWEAIDKQPLLQLATDGWKRSHCGQGTPLVNLMVLLPKGGSYFVKAEPARGVCKNAAWIAEQHLRWAAEVTKGDLSRMLGMVMDNTKVRATGLSASFTCVSKPHDDSAWYTLAP